MYFLILEDSGGLICWVPSYHLSIYISVTSICIVWSMFCWCFSIYWWNPRNPYKSSDFFNIFLDLTSVYCEIHEILIICHFSGILYSNLCVQVSGCWLQERRERDHCIIFCICFLKQLVFIYLFHYIVHFNSDPVLWTGVSNTTFKSSIYLHKSSDFLDIFEDFNLEYC